VGYEITQASTTEPFLFLLVSSADHITPVTGATPVVTISKNGGAFATPAGTVSEVGNGWYKIAGNAADSDTLGPLLLHAEATGADPCDEQYDIEPEGDDQNVNTVQPAATVRGVSARYVIVKALQSLGVFHPGEQLPAAKADAALDVLNDWADAFGAATLSMFTRTRVTKDLTSGVGGYTIGPGGAIDVSPRPLFIDVATIVLDTTATQPVEMELQLLSEFEYARWAVKSLQSRLPMALYFDQGWNTAGLGTITLVPVPNVGTVQLVLYLPSESVGQFADLDTEYAFPRGYRRMLTTQMALELADSYGAEVTPNLMRKAAEALGQVKRNNSFQDALRVDNAALSRPGKYNIYSDGYRR
jgi:hypothetical protein